MRTFWIALLSGGLLWLSFPPVGWWFLAWFALIPLVILICDLPGSDEKKLATFHGIVEQAANQPAYLTDIAENSAAILHCSILENGQSHRSSEPLRTMVLQSRERLQKLLRTKYWMLWLAGTAYWLATLYFIPIPHPLLWFGWAALSMYCGLFTPLFVATSRTLVHQYRWPVVFAVPFAFTGLEWVRSNFATGFAMACLSHSQFRNPTIIQVADLSGSYTLTFAMSLFATCIGLVFFAPNFGRRSDSNEVLKVGLPQRVVCLSLSLMVVLGVWGYGRFQLNRNYSTASIPLRVGLIQSSMDVIFVPLTEDQQAEHWRQLLSLTEQALHSWPDLDLIVWPESSLLLNDQLSDFNEKFTKTAADDSIRRFFEEVTAFKLQNPVSMIVGTTTYNPSEKQVFNSALLIEAPGEVKQRYFKNHRVLFGEYVPLSDWFPMLAETPIGRGLAPGTEFNSFDVRNVRIAPSICFESTVPHLIQRMINRLADQGKEPDVMINLTNDGWFFGTSCLDLHLACNVFRAVEMRKPHLVCANTGFSAEIGDNGRIQQLGPRRKAGILYAEVQSSAGRKSLYRSIGDVVPGTFGCVNLLLWILACLRSNSRN